MVAICYPIRYEYYQIAIKTKINCYGFMEVLSLRYAVTVE
jgi:hypothetical protein